MLTKLQNRSHHCFVCLLHLTGNLPWMARRSQRQRQSRGCQAVSIETSISISTSSDIRCIDIRTRFGTMAAYSFRCSKHDSSRFGQWKCPERSRHFGHGTGLVQLRPVHHSFDRPAGDDHQYQSLGDSYRRINCKEKKPKKKQAYNVHNPYPSSLSRS